MRTKNRQEQDRELILFRKKDSELSVSLMYFMGIKVLLSALNTVPQCCNFILPHRFVDKTDGVVIHGMLSSKDFLCRNVK